MKETLMQFGEVLYNASLKKYNTYKIETSAEYIVFPNSVESLIALLKYIKETNMKYIILGNGSNVILNDRHFNGIIIKLDRLDNIDISGQMITAGAGVMLPKLASESIEHNLAGLEWASAIPGTVGGATVGNAGAYNKSMFDFIQTVNIINENLELTTLNKDEIKHEYRHSSLKDNKKLIVVGVTLKLEPGDKEESLEIVKRRRIKRVETQPLEYPSAGSVFRNPPDDAAGRIIEQDVHLKGTTIGGAKVSEKHANFIINSNNATGKDIRDLIKFIHDKVLKETNIDLILEQEIIDWD